MFIYLSYLALLIFVVGFLSKLWGFATTPARLKIPTTPAPTSELGVTLRLANEVLFFRNLFKGNKWIWIGGWLFHIAFLLVILRHLRYFLDPLPQYWIVINHIGMYAGIALALPILYLAFRRFVVDRVKYISALGDFFILALLLLIAVTGVGLKYFYRPDIIAVKDFIVGIFTFEHSPFPDNPLFGLHYSLVLLLLVYFPFSKLMHVGGIFFSPSLNQADNPREKRHFEKVS